MTKEMLIIADDLSSAADCGIAFARHGLKTRLVVNPKGAGFRDEYETVSVDTDSRGVTAAVARSAGKGGFRNIYKSIDSTLRGNLGAENQHVDLIPLSTWRRGRVAVRAHIHALRRRGVRIMVFDSATESDLFLASRADLAPEQSLRLLQDRSCLLRAVSLQLLANRSRSSLSCAGYDA